MAYFLWWGVGAIVWMLRIVRRKIFAVGARACDVTFDERIIEELSFFPTEIAPITMKPPNSLTVTLGLTLALLTSFAVTSTLALTTGTSISSADDSQDNNGSDALLSTQTSAGRPGWFSCAWSSLLHLMTLSPRQHALQSLADSIERHIWRTQRPARALGIVVHSVDDGGSKDMEEDNHNPSHSYRQRYCHWLILQAPLHRNTNVHQTAFAGSLFSIGVLASFYLARQFMLDQGLLEDESQEKTCDSKSDTTIINRSNGKPTYTLVARSADIRYRRPVRSAWIKATSRLPDKEELQNFLSQLKARGKAMMTVQGSIMINGDGTENNDDQAVVACEYSVECCAYLPRTTTQQSS